MMRTAHQRFGQETWELCTCDGTPVPAFGVYCQKNSEYSFRTQKRYAEVTSRFIDYLFEAKAFDASVSAARLNTVIDAYPVLLRDGSQVTASRVRSSGLDLWLADTAEGLDWAPLSPKSFDNTVAAINRFLRLSESLARETAEKAALLGADPSCGYSALIRAIDGMEMLSRFEIAAMKQNSMFGNVAKFAPRGLQRARGLRSAASSRGSLRGQALDFPRESFASLIAAAETWRDKTFWLLLASSGIRTSEALNLHLVDIDLDAQKVFVFDPHSRRTQLKVGDPQRLRSKGRNTAATYLIPELREGLFYALKQYLTLEYVPAYEQGQPRYLLQYVQHSRRGQPYVDASPSALAQSFKRAVHAAGITDPQDGKSWTPHSLRHMYGVYMLNDFPVRPESGEFGLSLAEVQLMMGHASIRSTAHYARAKARRLEAKLAASDQAMLGLTIEQSRKLPTFGVHCDTRND